MDDINKAKNQVGINGRSSADSDDGMSSLNGLVSLTVSLPGGRRVLMDVDAKTPMMDVLVQIACKYGLAPSSVALRVPSERTSGYISYQPSTPVARLESRRVEIVDRAELSDRPSRPAQHRLPGLPFEPTQRIQIDLGRYQKTFVRISTAVSVAELLDKVCQQQALNRLRFRIRAAAAPHIALDEKSAIRDVGTTVFTLVPVDACCKRSQSTNDILSELVKMPIEEKQKKKKKGFFSGLFKSSKEKSKSKSPTREENGVANGAVVAEVSRPRPLAEVAIVDDRRRGESDLSQSSSRKKRVAPQPPEPATAAVAGSGRHSRRNSDSSSGYHESCASPTEDRSSSLEKSAVDGGSGGKKKSRAPSPPPSAQRAQQDGPDPSAVRRQSSHPVESAAVVTDKDGKEEDDENDIATGFDEAIFAGEQTMATPSGNQTMVEIDLNDIFPMPKVQPMLRTPDPQRAELPQIVASPAELEPPSVLSTLVAEVRSESLDQTVSPSSAAPQPEPVESVPIVVTSPPPPAPPAPIVVTSPPPPAPPPPPPTLLLSSKDTSVSNGPALQRPVTLQASPVLRQQLSIETPSPTDLSSQIAREAAEGLRKLSPIGQRRGFPMAQRQSNVVLNERQKDRMPAMRVASFEDEYAVRQYETQLRTTNSLANERDLVVPSSPNSRTTDDASDERLQNEYDKLRSMFDEWQVLSGRLEMRGGADDPTTNSRMRDLQRELVHQHQIVQRLCAIVQTDAARDTKNAHVDSGTERSGSSQSSVGTANSPIQSPSPPTEQPIARPKAATQPEPAEDKFFVKETIEVRSASKQPTGGNDMYRPKLHTDNAAVSPTNTPLRHDKNANGPSKRPISVHGTAIAKTNVSASNGHDIEHAFRQTKHPSTEDLVVNEGVVKPSMLFGGRKQNTIAMRSTHPVHKNSETAVTSVRQAASSTKTPSVDKSSETAVTSVHQAASSTKTPSVDKNSEMAVRQAASSTKTSPVNKSSETAVTSVHQAASSTKTTKNATAPNTHIFSAPLKATKVDQSAELKKVPRSEDPVPNGSGGFAWPELRKVAPPVEKNGIELGAVVTSPKTDTVSRNYSIADKTKRQPISTQSANNENSSIVNGAAKKAHTTSFVQSPSPTEPSPKNPVVNGNSTTIFVPPPPPPPPPPPQLGQLVAQMAQVTLKPAGERKVKQVTANNPPVTESRDELLQAIRNAGGIGSLKKIQPVA